MIMMDYDADADEDIDGAITQAKLLGSVPHLACA